MVFQPVIPMSGFGGWNFLQSTYDRQLEVHSNTPQIKNDREYMVEKLSSPIAVEDFLDDQRLLRVTMTAFDLGGEEWKRGFISKVLTEAADPESTFLARLNNPQYTAFAETFAPSDGEVSISLDSLVEVGERFEAASFEIAVGEVDDTMRLALNYQGEIAETVESSGSEDTILYKILGNVPLRSVMESALNLPAEVTKLSIDRQAEILKERLSSVFGINDATELAEPDKIERVIQRYHAMESLNSSQSATSSGSIALTLLGGSSGLGSSASQNLFLSQF